MEHNATDQEIIIVYVKRKKKVVKDFIYLTTPGDYKTPVVVVNSSNYDAERKDNNEKKST